jgi:hypothetical protein
MPNNFKCPFIANRVCRVLRLFSAFLGSGGSDKSQKRTVLQRTQVVNVFAAREVEIL